MPVKDGVTARRATSGLQADLNAYRRCTVAVSGSEGTALGTRCVLTAASADGMMPQILARPYHVVGLHSGNAVCLHLETHSIITGAE